MKFWKIIRIVIFTVLFSTVQVSTSFASARFQTKPSEVQTLCANTSNWFFPKYLQWKKSGHKLSILFNEKTLSQIQKYYQRCYINPSLLSVIDLEDPAELKRVFHQNYVAIFERKEEGESPKPICSGTIIESVIFVPRHCFFDSGTRQKSVSHSWFAVVFDFMSKDYSRVISLREWNAFQISGASSRLYSHRNYDLYIFVEGDQEVNNILESLDIKSPIFGEDSLTLGFSVINTEIVGMRNSKFDLKKFMSTLLVGGFKSYCLVDEKPDGLVKQHFCESTGGTSGAPIFQYHQDSFYPIGVHLGGQGSHFDNVKNFMISLDRLRGMKYEKIELP